MIAAQTSSSTITSNHHPGTPGQHVKKAGALNNGHDGLSYKNVITTQTQQSPSILEKRHGLDEVSHSRASPNMGDNAISRTPGFLPSQE